MAGLKRIWSFLFLCLLSQCAPSLQAPTTESSTAWWWPRWGTTGYPGNTQFDCDFDSGLCGWTQDVSDSFDWSLLSGSTPSSNTGPSSDHTTGFGKYIYIEATPQAQGDVARITSPEVIAYGKKCLQFYYHMYGFTIDTLNVYVSKVGDPLGSPLFQIVGQQGNSWNLTQVNIMRADTNRFVVTLEGKRGSSYTGDIAIDDIIMFSGSCSPDDGQFDCDFDSGLCGWTQDVTDSFDWTVQSGSTSSSGTGPSSDHTTGSGQYIYIETSGRVQGDFARLTSPAVIAHGTKCLQFYYHMYGATIDTLNVYVSKVGDPLRSPLIQIVGQQGNSWNLTQVDIMRTDTEIFVVTLEGICGSSYTGDIAIDDIIMLSGSCSPERELICDSTSMTLLLDRDLLEISDDAHDVHFKDESCVGYDHDSQHVAITTMYDRCDTKQEQEEDNMVFSNVVTYYKPQSENGTSGIITRKQYLHIPVTCYLKRERILGESFTPYVDKYTYDEEGYGEFSLSLDRYTNAGFYQHANDSGMVELGTPLYFGVTLNSVTNLTLLIESCWATSSPYPLDDHRYDIIEDGCAVDSTTYIYYTSSPTFEKFRVDAFTFIGDYDQVFVHCSVLICDYRDAGSRCAQGCLSRARRSLLSTGSRSKPHTITHGPLSDASHFKHTMMFDNDDDGGETYDPLMIAALSALCVLIALTVIMSLVVVRMRRRHGPEMIGYRRVGVAEDY